MNRFQQTIDARNEPIATLELRQDCAATRFRSTAKGVRLAKKKFLVNNVSVLKTTTCVAASEGKTGVEVGTRRYERVRGAVPALWSAMLIWFNPFSRKDFGFRYFVPSLTGCVSGYPDGRTPMTCIVAILAVVVALVASPRPSPAQPTTTQPAAEMTALRGEVASHRSELMALRPENVALRQEVTALRQPAAATQPATRPTTVPTTNPATRPATLPVTTIVKPGESIQFAIDSTPNGGTVLVQPGIYVQSFKVDRPLTVSGYDAVLQGNETLPYGIDATAATVKGFKVQRFRSKYGSADSAVRVRLGATAQDLIVANNVGSGIGIPVGSHGARLLDCRSNANGYSNIRGTESDDVLIQGGDYTGANVGHVLNVEQANAEQKDGFFLNPQGLGIVSPGFDLNKFTRMNRMRVVGATFGGSFGEGLWFDVGNRKVDIVGCTFRGGYRVRNSEKIQSYAAFGLFIEYNIGPFSVTGCTFDKSEGSALAVAETSDVTVAGNTFNKGANMELRAMRYKGKDGKVFPGRPHTTRDGVSFVLQLKNILIERNTFADGRNVNAVTTGGSIHPSLDYDKLDPANAATIVVRENK